MSQLQAAIGRTILLAWLVAATVSILAVGVLGSEDRASGCSTTGLGADVSTVGTPVPTSADIPGAGATASGAPVASTADICGARAPSLTPSPTSSLSPAVPSPTAELTIGIEARDLYFSPTEVSVPAVGATRMVLTNHGYVAHNLTVDELGIELVASRGGSHELTLVDPPAGVYTFYCSVSGHREAGMDGTLVIE